MNHTLLNVMHLYDFDAYLIEGVKASKTHHIGDTWLNFLVNADDDFDQNIAQVTFSPKSTLD